jgi:predicted ester cyclase
MGIENTERARRRALLHAHYAAENANDLDRIMKTFAADTVMLYNRQSFADHDGIRQAHGYIGFAGNGAFSGLHNLTDQEHFTDDEIVVEGRVCGTHTGEFQGFAPSGREVELPFVAFYGFDGAGKLRSERVVMNLGPLAAAPI